MKYIVDIVPTGGGDGDEALGLYALVGILCGIATYYCVHGAEWTHSDIGRLGEVLLILACSFLGPFIIAIAIGLGIILIGITLILMLLCWIIEG
jgi:hypothetical protein